MSFCRFLSDRSKLLKKEKIKEKGIELCRIESRVMSKKIRSLIGRIINRRG